MIATDVVEVVEQLVKNKINFRIVSILDESTLSDTVNPKKFAIMIDASADLFDFFSWLTNSTVASAYRPEIKIAEGILQIF